MKQQPPLFSVVITTYNYGHLIERAVGSVFAQTFEQYELIVVDDGSTDDTEERLREYSDRLRYLKKANGGQSSAINVGAEQASGTYIYVLDADDELVPQALAKFKEAIDEAQGESCLFYGGYISVSEDGEERERKSTDSPQQSRQALSAFLRKKISGLKNGAYVIPRTAFERIRYPENLRNNTDIVFIGQALTMFPARNIDATVLKSHEHAQRTRKQLDRIVGAGIRPVDALFDPRIVPADLMSLRRVHLGHRWRSIARVYYLHGLYKEASDAYFSALKAFPPALLEWGSLRRAFVSYFKAGRSPG
jgi:glycosyltransferase involved in cell wall biosynthesis